MKELNIQRLIQIAASESGTITFRNNCGAYKTEEGGYVRYGVGSPGGSDLIGITPVIVTPEMAGKTIGVFTAIEVKTPIGRISKDQQYFTSAINKAGGIAIFARSADDAIFELQEAINLLSLK
jgi:hypothetical protein